jgi:hypothetical protein
MEIRIREGTFSFDVSSFFLVGQSAGKSEEILVFFFTQPKGKNTP